RLRTVRASLPAQKVSGNDSIEAGLGTTDIFGRLMSQVYTGAFTILLPTISGTVTNTGGVAVAGVALQPSGGLQPALTDGSGVYSIGVPPGWNGAVTPSLPGWMFVPGARSYTNLSGSVTGQDSL